MSRQFVIFSLEEQLYAVDISLVSEITEIKDLTKVPNAKDSTEGVLDLRGKVIPIINMKRMMKIQNATHGNQILVIEHGDKLIGLIIDHAKDVKVVNDENIENIETSISNKSENSIKSVIKDLGNQLILIIDLPTMLNNIVEEQLAYA